MLVPWTNAGMTPSGNLPVLDSSNTAILPPGPLKGTATRSLLATHTHHYSYFLILLLLLHIFPSKQQLLNIAIFRLTYFLWERNCKINLPWKPSHSPGICRDRFLMFSMWADLWAGVPFRCLNFETRPKYENIVRGFEYCTTIWRKKLVAVQIQISLLIIWTFHDFKMAYQIQLKSVSVQVRKTLNLVCLAE